MKTKVILTVDGIRTFRQWQERLETLINEASPTAKVEH